MICSCGCTVTSIPDYCGCRVNVGNGVGGAHMTVNWLHEMIEMGVGGCGTYM